MDVVIGHLQVHVPPGSPLDLRHLPGDVVGPDHLATFRRVDHLGLVALEVAGGRLRARRELDVGHGRLVPLAVVGVLDRERDHREADDVVALLTLLGHASHVRVVNRVVLDLEAEVVVENVRVGLLLGTLFGELAADGVSEVVDLDLLVGLRLQRVRGHLGDGQVVEAHVHPVFQDREILEFLHLLRGVLHPAQRLAVLVHLHQRLERGGVGLLARERLPEVLRQVMHLLGLAERQLVVVKLERSLRGDESLNLHVDRLAILEGARRHTREVERLREGENGDGQ
mmetsp:Transcript_52877/g.125836  ORF Transcript_52877/g.125836 Transcript_52877/m.125836 type:complete len:284 (-) Transcript_52877:60-911(-)